MVLSFKLARFLFKKRLSILNSWDLQDNITTHLWFIINIGKYPICVKYFYNSLVNGWSGCSVFNVIEFAIANFDSSIPMVVYCLDTAIEAQ